MAEGSLIIDPSKPPPELPDPDHQFMLSLLKHWTSAGTVTRTLEGRLPKLDPPPDKLQAARAIGAMLGAKRTRRAVTQLLWAKLQEDGSSARYRQVQAWVEKLRESCKLAARAGQAGLVLPRSHFGS